MIRFDQIEWLQNQSKKQIITERERYSDAYDIIENYLRENSDTNILGADISIKKILEEDKTKDDYKYEIYANNGLKTAFDLSNLLADKYPITNSESNQIFIMMKSFIPYYNYRIFVDTRFLVDIYHIGDTYLNRIKKDKFSLLSPDNLLIDVYHNLYLPNKAETWEDMIKHESNIFRYFEKFRNTDLTKLEKNGGDESERQKFQNLSIELLKKIGQDERSVLIGEHSIYSLNKNTDRKFDFPENYNLPTAITFIHSDPESLYPEITEITQKIFKKNPEYKTKSLNLVHDPRLKRTTYKLENRDILYVYNSSEYELIPKITINGFNVANTLVINRFLFVELHILYNLLHKNKLHMSTANYKINLFITLAKNIRKTIASKNGELQTVNSLHKTTQKGLLELFPYKSKDYVGTNRNEVSYLKDQAKMIKMKNQLKGNRITDYYPQKNKK